MPKKRVPDPLDQMIGRNIRAHRSAIGLSQRALGERLGAIYQQIQKYENATNRVPASRLARIASALDVTTDVLMSHGPKAVECEKSSRFPQSAQQRRLMRASSKISDPRLLNLAVKLIEGFAKL